MKKYLFLFAFVFSFISGFADIYPDFSVDGIHYKITNPSKLEVAVTFEKYVTGYNYTYYNSTYNGKVIIPETVKYGNRIFKVTSIGERAFINSKDLNSVVIPEGVISINERAFYDCINLTDIQFANTIDSIAARAFYNCNLQSLNLPNSLRIIGHDAFLSCGNIETVIIPDEVISIGSYAFESTGLKSITLSKNLKAFGTDVFEHCSLEKIVCRAGTPPVTEDQKFSTLQYTLVDVVVPKGSLEAYKKVNFWKNFPFMYEDEGENKCATPTITFVDGKLTFGCETPGAEFHYAIKNDDVSSGTITDDSLPITGKYKVSVYATAEGYSQSDTVEEIVEIKNVAGVKGDVTKDDMVDVDDVQTVINIILGI